MSSSDENTKESGSLEAYRSKHPEQFSKAEETALHGCVKMHIFSPSGRVIYTVVGRSEEEFIDPSKPFCSCKDFFFGVLGGRNETCYHLLSYEIAKEASRLDRIVLHDEEFGSFVGLLANDITSRANSRERSS